MFKTVLLIACVAIGAQARMTPFHTRVWGYPMDKIVGGSEVEPNSIPYQVSLQTSGFHFCGGAVYDEMTVITAAHCCRGDQPGDFQVIAGEHNLRKDEGNEQTREVTEIIMHETYGDPTTHSNDICLLKLDVALDFNGLVDAAPMPTQGQDDYDENTKIVVSGWGTLKPGGSSPDELYSVVVPFVNDDDCRISYGADAIDDSMICSGEEGVDSCQGDSGGPMTCDGAHCGIVSWGVSCASAGYPGVYVQTSYFVDWIKTNA
eukprot:maker-scaffold270_size230592-snap-gene-1.27 protein:Tk10976 transcript:maker-scaffold270_size230592-snap-gene-1.27-mRNA-1 annotation:"trypsin-like serine proteinase 1"